MPISTSPVLLFRQLCRHYILVQGNWRIFIPRPSIVYCTERTSKFSIYLSIGVTTAGTGRCLLCPKNHSNTRIKEKRILKRRVYSVLQKARTLLLSSALALEALVEGDGVAVVTAQVVQIFHLVDADDPVLAGERFLEGVELRALGRQLHATNAIDGLAGGKREL